jgi:ABC-type phosphate/phosphonate transport system substrate-binding protein
MLILSLPPCIMAETDQQPELILAYSLKTIPDVDPKDAGAAFSTYAAELGVGLGLKVIIKTYENVDVAVDELLKGKVDLASVTSIEYLRIKNPSGLDLGIGSVKGGKKTTMYVILSHNNKGYTKISDLKNKRITILKGDDVAHLYLNTALLKQKFGEAKDFFSHIDEKNKASQVVLPVFFGQADACVISEISYRTMVEMNPQLGKDLKVIMTSPELLTGMGVFRKGLTASFRERIISVARNLKSYSRGKQVLLLFKLDGLEAVTESDLTGIKELYSDYERLKGHR